MKKMFLTALLVLGIGAPLQSQAVVCLAAAPVCGIVFAGVAIGGLLGLTEKGEIKPLQVGAIDETALRQLFKDLKAKDRYFDLTMAKYASYGNGYADVVGYYQTGRIDGRLSLTSLKNFDPELFAHLDLLNSVVTAYVPAEKVKAVYGEKLNADGSINWARYAVLASDALTLYEATFAIR